MALSIGDKAPDFTLPDQDNKIHRLSGYRGRWVVVYFYPKDFTPGCTKEACSVRDKGKELARVGLPVLGISKDSVDSHRQFAQKFQLSSPLLSDPEHKVIEAYGAWQLKNLYGRVNWATKRMTFLIDPEGNLAQIWSKVTPDGHADEILKVFAAVKSP